MNDVYESPTSTLENEVVNNSGEGDVGELPDGIKGWSWGAFLLNWVWAIGNRTWIGLLALIPYAGFIFAIILGFKGREWAWRNKKWNSVNHFNKVQKQWSFWGVLLILGSLALGIALVAAAYIFQ